MAKPDIEKRCLMAAEIRAEGDGKKLVGYAAVFDAPYDSGWMVEYVRKGAFSRALSENQDVRALFDHDSSVVLGRRSAKTLTLAEDDKGLRFEIDLPDTQAARDLRILVERGDITGMSFGFRVIKEQWDESGPKPVRTLLDVDLLEVSVVTFPAYADTSVGVRSLEDWRKEHQYKPSLATLQKRQQQAQSLG